VLKAQTADLVVHEVGSSLPGALCGSHLGALGLQVTAWRDPVGTPGPEPGDWGWDWCKTVRIGRPDPRPESPPDVLIDGRPLGAQPIPGAGVTCRILGDWDLGIEVVPEVIAQAIVGLTGYVGTQDAPPIRIGAPVVTMATGVAAAQGVLAGLAWRERHDAPCTVTVTAVGVGFALAGNNVTSESDPEQRTGFAGQPWAPARRGYACRDGTVDFVFHRDNGGFAEFCRWLGVADVAADDRFRSHAARNENEAALALALAPALQSHDADEVVTQLDAAGALVARRLRVDELPSDPQISAIGLLAKSPGRGPTIVQLPFTINGNRPDATAVIKEGSSA
jgi:hypothetical protein